MGLLNKTSRFFLRHGVPPYPDQPDHALTGDTLIAYGSKRECHQHPDNPDRCIKVARKPEHPEAQQPSIVEWYCATTLDRRGVSFVYRARCHGWVATNRGPGLVMERVRDADSQPSPTLFEYARRTRLTGEQFAAMYAELKHWVLENAVPITDLNTGNLMVRHRDGRPYLVFVDGIGGQKVKLKFVLYRRLPWFARLLSRHRWPRLEQRAYKQVQKAWRSNRSHDAPRAGPCRPGDRKSVV